MSKKQKPMTDEQYRDSDGCQCPFCRGYIDLMNALSRSNNTTRAFKIVLDICNRLWDFLPRELEGEAIKQIEQIAEESNAKED